MYTQTKPTIVLIPGAWHSPVHYTTLIDLLEQAGYPVFPCRLPSVDASDPNIVSVATDTDFIQNRLLIPLLAEGKDILLIMHSYGGMPGSAAAKGLSKRERQAAGKAGGILGLVYIAAVLSHEGQSLEEVMGGELHDFVLQKDTGYCYVNNPQEIFYNDVEPSIAATNAAALKSQSLHSFRSPSGPPAWSDSVFDGGRGYIMCMLDQGITVFGEQMMVKHSGVEWDVKKFQSGHCPMLSMPEKTAEAVIAWGQEWAETGEKK